MTREEAIHFATCLKNNWTINFADMEDFCDMAIEALSAVCDDCIWHVCNYNKVDWDTPSAEAVEGWIPVSERLPDVGKDVLLQFRDNQCVGNRCPDYDYLQPPGESVGEGHD